MKFGKIFLTGGTMLISIAVYAWIYGWRYAVGFVALLFVHEMGHFIAARQRGLPVGAPTFIPFVGAWIDMKQMPHDAETEAYVGLGGPLVGSLGALACLPDRVREGSTRPGRCQRHRQQARQAMPGKIHLRATPIVPDHSKSRPPSA